MKDLQSHFDSVDPGTPKKQRILKLSPGTYAGGARLRKPYVTVRGGFGCQVLGGRDGIRLMPEAIGSRLEKLTIRSSGIFAAFLGADGAKVIGCRIYSPGRSGILTAGVSHVRIEGNLIDGAEDEHAIYASDGGEDIMITGNTCRNSKKAAIQVNGEPRRFRRVTVTENTCRNSGSFDIQMFAVSEAVVAGNDLEGAGHGTLALWDLDDPKRFYCEDIDLRGQSGEPFSIAESCRQGLRLPA